MPSATSYSPRSFGCVNSMPELNILPNIVFGWAVNIAGSMVKRVSSTSKVIRFSIWLDDDWTIVGDGVDVVEQWANGDDIAVDRFIGWDFVMKLLLLLLLLLLRAFLDNKETNEQRINITSERFSIKCWSEMRTLVDFCIDDVVVHHPLRMSCRNCRLYFVVDSKTFRPAPNYFAYGKIRTIEKTPKCLVNF